jgi:peptidoglycan/LPS O-acetylase OafA/YrhL
MSVTLPGAKNRNHTIDLLRFVSAAYVALFHFNAPMQFTTSWYADFCNRGKLGVPVFFIISGYCIRLAHKHTKTPRGFIIRRLFRIFPPYWFSLFVTALCILILKIVTGYNSVVALPKKLGEILVTPLLYTYPLSNIQPINMVYWTLPYELFFYLIIFLAIIPAPKWRMVLPLALTATAIIIPLQKTGILFFFNELPTFMLGYALCILIDEGLQWPGVLLFIISAAGIAIKHPEIGYLLASVIAVGAIFIDSRKPLANNFLSRLGDISYSIYLLHVPVCVYLLGFLYRAKAVQHYLILNILVDIFLMTVIIFVSMFAFKYVEAPSIEWGKKLSRKKVKI